MCLLGIANSARADSEVPLMDDRSCGYRYFTVYLIASGPSSIFFRNTKVAESYSYIGAGMIQIRIILSYLFKVG